MKPNRRLNRIHRCLAAEDGIAIIVALAATIVLGIAGTSAYVYTSSNTRAARLGAAETSAYAVAEAGLQQAFSVLNNPDNNALDSSVLPLCSTGSDCGTTTLAEGYAHWGGGLCDGSATEPTWCDADATEAPYWIVASTGYVRNPDSQQLATQTVRARLNVVPTLTKPVNNPAWNYIYATHPLTPGVCDETIQQSVTVVSPLYVNGNLCLQNTATIGAGPLDVRGSLTMFQKQNSVGSPGQKISDAHIGGGCWYWNKGFDNPCKGPADNVYAQTLDSTFVEVPPPEPAWDDWYLNASPGPYFPCNDPSGPVPVFDNDQGTTPDASHRNGSVATPFNLTPSVSYTCKTAGGELSWDALNHRLTISGTIFIDGSAYVQNGQVNTYTGQGTLYLSGSYFQKNSELCASVDPSTGTCETSGWDPNQAILGIVANGSGGLANSWDGAQFVSSTFQGAVYTTYSIDTDTTSAVLGPMLADTINLGQSVNTAFPKVTIVPAGFPGDLAVYAQPQQPIYLG